MRQLENKIYLDERRQQILNDARVANGGSLTLRHGRA
jgi:hypothetical protein